MKQPLVSILMPCYNAEAYVEESMISILNQTYSNMEIIAIDDCSADGTFGILERMAKCDTRIKIVENKGNLKLIQTLNKGISLCNGEYIARMDSDDIALPTRIEKEVEFLENNKDHDIVSTQFKTFYSKTPNKLNLHHNPTRDEELRAYILFRSGICHPAVMIRRRVFTELGLNFEMEYLHVEDFALWSKAIYMTKIANIGEPLLHYRVHEQQVSSLNEQLQIENKKKVFKIHCDKLGLPSDDKYLDIYSSVAECVPREKTIDYLNKCEQFILSLIELNRHQVFCDHNYLKSLLSLYWLRLCGNSQLGIKAISCARRSTIYSISNYQLRDLAILYIKCIFKIKYKESFIYKLIFR